MSNHRIPLEPEKYYHIYNHGVGHLDVYQEDADYNFFMKKYNHYASPVANTYAYCLMPNHFHFIIQIKPKDEVIRYLQQKYFSINKAALKNGNCLANRLSHEFGTLFNCYSKHYNFIYRRRGGLFMQSFKRKLIKNNEYFNQLILYVHANPIEAGISNRFEDWKYSSYLSILKRKNTVLSSERILEAFGGHDNYIYTHNQYIKSSQPNP